MNIRDVVRKAWQMTQAHLRKLIWYGAVPAFLSIVVSSGYFAYQYNAFKNSPLFSDEEYSFFETVNEVWGLFSGHTTFAIILLVLGILFFIGNYLIPPIFQGILIQAVSQIENYKSIKGSAEVGIRRFFPMFEFGLVMGAFKITTLFSESSFILRWWGVNIFKFVLPLLLFIAIAGFILNFLFNYTEYFIVLRDMKLIKAMKESAIMVIANLRKTFLVFILMILISLRIILNVVLVLLIPMLVVALGTYVAGTFWSTVGFVLIGLVSLGILVVSAYLFGLFNIFTTTVWVLTFHMLAEKGTVDSGEGQKTHDEKEALKDVAKPL